MKEPIHPDDYTGELSDNQYVEKLKLYIYNIMVMVL